MKKPVILIAAVLMVCAGLFFASQGISQQNNTTPLLQSESLVVQGVLKAKKAFERNDMVLAETEAKQALMLSHDDPHRMILMEVMLLNLLGAIKSQQTNYQQARDYGLEALALWEKDDSGAPRLPPELWNEEYKQTQEVYHVFQNSIRLITLAGVCYNEGKLKNYKAVVNRINAEQNFLDALESEVNTLLPEYHKLQQRIYVDLDNLQRIKAISYARQGNLDKAQLTINNAISKAITHGSIKLLPMLYKAKVQIETGQVY